MDNSEKDVKVIITYSPKGVGIALLLTFIFGPIGMLYSTVWAAFAVRSYNNKLLKI